MDSDEKLKLDYERVIDCWKTLADIRFKLLAFVPALGGAGLGATLAAKLTGAQLFAISLLGFLATFAIIMYDQRNSQLYNDASARARWLEGQLGFKSHYQEGWKDDTGGLFRQRPGRTRQIFGIILWHDKALSIIYAASLAAWVFLAVRGIETSSLFGGPSGNTIRHPDRYGLILALVAGFVAYTQQMKYETKPKP
jgi:hypothetical protein